MGICLVMREGMLMVEGCLWVNVCVEVKFSKEFCCSDRLFFKWCFMRCFWLVVDYCIIVVYGGFISNVIINFKVEYEDFVFVVRY